MERVRGRPRRNARAPFGIFAKKGDCLRARDETLLRARCLRRYVRVRQRVVRVPQRREGTGDGAVQERVGERVWHHERS